MSFSFSHGSIPIFSQFLYGETQMNAWLEFIIIWLTLDALIMIGLWFAITNIKPRFPQLWQRIVVDEEPFYRDFYK
jgi:hypothetical protein